MRILSASEAQPIHEFASRYVDGQRITDLQLDRLKTDGWKPLVVFEGAIIEFYQKVLGSNYYHDSSCYSLGFVNVAKPERIDFQMKHNNPILIDNISLQHDVDELLFEDCKIIISQDFEFFLINLFTDWGIFFSRPSVMKRIKFNFNWLENPFGSNPVISDFSGLEAFWTSQFPEVKQAD